MLDGRNRVTGIFTIEDLRRRARSRLPRVLFDYIDGGADGEVTLRENCAVFDRVRFLPRNAAAMGTCSLRTTVLGTPVELPFLLAPVGSSRMFFPRGECVAAAQAGVAGTAYVLSTLSGCRLEEVKAASSGPVWYQLYLIGGREAATAAIERARAAGFSALVVTIDTAVAGQRERDLRNGGRELLSGNTLKMLPHLGQLLARPTWLLGYLRDGGLMKFPNVVIPGKGPMAYEDVGAALERSTMTWQDIAWIRAAWQGPIVVKGVLGAEDARRALDAGADAIVVSNHGGRQLDCVAPTLLALPEVIDAVAGRTEVYLDGGIRRGSDVVKAIALGARAVLVGRAYAYGLGAAGGPGVGKAIEILRSGIVRTLRLLGCLDVNMLDRSYVNRRSRERSRRYRRWRETFAELTVAPNGSENPVIFRVARSAGGIVPVRYGSIALEVRPDQSRAVEPELLDVEAALERYGLRRLSARADSIDYSAASIADGHILPVPLDPAGILVAGIQIEHSQRLAFFRKLQEYGFCRSVPAVDKKIAGVIVAAKEGRIHFIVFVRFGTTHRFGVDGNRTVKVRREIRKGEIAGCRIDGAAVRSPRGRRFRCWARCRRRWKSRTSGSTADRSRSRRHGSPDRAARESQPHRSRAASGRVARSTQPHRAQGAYGP